MPMDQTSPWMSPYMSAALGSMGETALSPEELQMRLKMGGFMPPSKAMQSQANAMPAPDLDAQNYSTGRSPASQGVMAQGSMDSANEAPPQRPQDSLNMAYQNQVGKMNDLLKMQAGVQAAQPLSSQVNLSGLGRLADVLSNPEQRGAEKAYVESGQIPQTPEAIAQTQFDQQQDLTKDQMDLIKQKMMAQMMGNRQDLLAQNMLTRQAMLGLRQDQQAAGASTAIQKDPIMLASGKQLKQIEIDSHTLQNAKMITPQMVHEISNGIANALGGGGGVGLGMADKQDLSTSQTKIAQMEQMLTNKPELGTSPQMRAYMINTLQRLGGAYQNAQYARAQQLQVGKEYGHNAAGQRAVKATVESFKPQAPSSSTSEATIKVKAPDGKTGSFPADKPLPAGYTKVE